MPSRALIGTHGFGFGVRGVNLKLVPISLSGMHHCAISAIDTEPPFIALCIGLSLFGILGSLTLGDLVVMAISCDVIAMGPVATRGTCTGVGGSSFSLFLAVSMGSASCFPRNLYPKKLLLLLSAHSVHAWYLLTSTKSSSPSS